MAYKIFMGGSGMTELIKCTDISFASYNCAYNIMPPWVDKYVAIDKCLMREILDLWEMGIKTTGCCCGHGRNGMQFIGVEEEYALQMHNMGYKDSYNPHNPTSLTTFIPKTKVLNFVKIPYKFNWWEVQE